MDKIYLKQTLIHKFENIIDKVITKIQKRGWLLDARREGKLLYISEIKDFFDNTDFFCFGTGGSVSNLKNIQAIKNKNIIATTYAPYYFQKLYDIKVSVWPISYGPVVDYVLQLEKTEGFKMDLSETLVVVPTVESNTKVNIMSPSISRLRKAHPEATFVLCHRMEASVTSSKIPNFFLKKGVEPLLCYDDNTLHNLFVPFLAYLGVSKIYFSGIDLIPSTGHFWNRKLFYQNMQGLHLKFPEDDKLDLGRDIIKRSLLNMEIFRLENNETRLKCYPYINFDKVVNNTKNRKQISDIISKVSPILVTKCY